MENETTIETPEVNVAEGYIESALKASQDTLQKTRVIAAAASVFFVGYLGYVTATFHSNLEPEGAATVAAGLAAQRIDDLEPTLTAFIHEQIPQAIRQAPDTIIARLPEMRQQLEDKVEGDLRAHSEESSKKLADLMNRFVAEHKDEIGSFAKDAQDPANADKIGDALEKEFVAYLHTEQIAGSTIAEKLDNTLEALEQVDARTARLALNKKLTPGEQKARHAVALLMHRINSTPDDGTVAVAHSTVKGIAAAFHP